MVARWQRSQCWGYWIFSERSSIQSLNFWKLQCGPFQSLICGNYWLEPIGQHFVKFWHQPAKFEIQIRRPFATNTWSKGIVLPCYYLKKPINWGNHHWKFTCTIAGEENPNISKPSRLPGGCKGGRFILPDLCCFVISWFTLSLTISQHLAAETWKNTSFGQCSKETWKYRSTTD